MKLSRSTFTDCIVAATVAFVLVLLFAEAREANLRNRDQIATQGFGKIVADRHAAQQAAQQD